MVIETGVIIAGTGHAGSAVARELASDFADNAPYILLDKKHGEMLLDIILSDAGDVTGALVMRNGNVEAIRAPSIVLATGGIEGLFAADAWHQSGDGLAIAHRAGLDLTRPHVVETDGRQELRAGIRCDADGRTDLSGLFVAGNLGADRPDAVRVARAAIVHSREGVDKLGPYHVQPPIDSPLPAGFTHVKFERLARITTAALDQSMPIERARIELHRLKGEADEFARARVDIELFSLKNACEVSLLIF